MPVEIKVPSAGESVTEVVLARWLKKDGEYAKLDEPVAELETDKATAEVVAPAAGAVRASIAEGTTVPVGAVIGRIEEGAAQPSPPPQAMVAAAPARGPQVPVAKAPPAPPTPRSSGSSSPEPPCGGVPRDRAPHAARSAPRTGGRRRQVSLTWPDQRKEVVLTSDSTCGTLEVTGR